MKAKDLRTLEAFLAEYSGIGQQPEKPGSAPSKRVASGRQAHDNADAQKAERDRKAAGLPKDDINTELSSPSRNVSNQIEECKKVNDKEPASDIIECK